MGEVVLATEENIDQQIMHTDHEAKKGGGDGGARAAGDRCAAVAAPAAPRPLGHGGADARDRAREDRAARPRALLCGARRWRARRRPRALRAAPRARPAAAIAASAPRSARDRWTWTTWRATVSRSVRRAAAAQAARPGAPGSGGAAAAARRPPPPDSDAAPERRAVRGGGRGRRRGRAPRAERAA
ncbi:hypothetical protein SO694_00094013 [Aureococcus anophagefferens]|uniref:Uncharacterized protein n=1 Tax=Aureococcus anophagefferens TaxID=44056 RepID=A0ABR1FSJ4_AURAN